MKLHAALGLPAMTRKEIRICKKILMSFGRKRKIKIFEYGSGYSTLYYSRFLSKKGFKFHLHSVDNNPSWHQRVQTLVRKSGLEGEISLHMFPFPAFWEKNGWDWHRKPQCGEFSPILQEEIEYISLPRKLNIKFDLILVDARFRRRCLEVARDCLTERGFVILHDAQKGHYQSAFIKYRYSIPS